MIDKNQFTDRVRITIKSGDGGDGMNSFKSFKGKPACGPDGGDGGKGGDVYLLADRSMNDLLSFRFTNKYVAGNGERGGTNRCSGKGGADVVIKVPVGTIVRDYETKTIICDMFRDGDKFLLAEGGRGGKGNVRFTTARRHAPNFAQKGEKTEEHIVLLELKVIADVGIIGFPNGGGNYGSRRHIKGQQKEVFAILGFIVDKKNNPIYSKEDLSTLIHEFNHSFINPTVEKNLQVLESPCERLYQFVSSRMKAQAYGHWSTLTYESLVRAAEICYRMDNGYSDKEIQDALMNEINRGFWWTPELVVLLRKYERKKEKYGSFDNFFPQLVRFFERQADKECRRMQKAIDSQYMK